MALVSVCSCKDLPDPNMSEILRYAGVGDGDEATLCLVRECIEQSREVIRAAVCYAEFDIQRREGELDLGFCRVRSRDLERNLEGCSSIILFAATLGVGADRLIARYSRLLPSRALIIDAIMTERIECVCDLFEREVCGGIYSRPRFSAGYGDLPITLQEDIFRALRPEREIGLTLTGSLLMSPTKSVTAIKGIRR